MCRVDAPLPEQAGKAHHASTRLSPKLEVLEVLEVRPRDKNQKYEVLVFSERESSIDPNEMAKILVRALQEREAKRLLDEHNRAA